MTQVLGIVNITRDSFSDGGAAFGTEAALRHAEQLLADGADVLDLGAESTHPDSEDVSASEEMRRLAPVLERLVADGVRCSVDTWKPDVMRFAIERGATMVNDVRGMQDPAAIAAVAGEDVDVIVMHSVSSTGRAQRQDTAPTPQAIAAFLTERTAALSAAGHDPARVVIDPGMGFFLSKDPQVSLAVLRRIDLLRATGQRVLIATSRKSFLGDLLGRPVDQRGAGTLATELWAWQRGADYVRTHDVRQFVDARMIFAALQDENA